MKKTFFKSGGKTSKHFNSAAAGRLTAQKFLDTNCLSVPGFCILFYKDLIKLVKTRVHASAVAPVGFALNLQGRDAGGRESGWVGRGRWGQQSLVACAGVALGALCVQGSPTWQRASAPPFTAE